MRVDIVFVILTFAEMGDLINLLNSIENSSDYSYKIIVVNNYYDDATLEWVTDYCRSNNIVLIKNENTGYSDGNNKGISYAIDNYDFSFLIVSNPDILIDQFRLIDLKGFTDDIIAPEIRNQKNKKQNPLYYREILLSEKYIYSGFINNKKSHLLTGIALNKVDKIKNRFLELFHSKNKAIFSPHGSFIIFSKNALVKLNPVFDKNMFLFCEEGELAQKAKHNNVKIVYSRNIKIKHLEDKSMAFSSDINLHLKKSYIYYFNKWLKNEKRKL